MACLGRYAEAWQFAAFFCSGTLLSGADNSGGALNAYLTSSFGGFAKSGVKAGVGMMLYNLTTGANGPITAFTDTTITATGVTWSNGNRYRVVTISAAEQAQIEYMLELTAQDINAVLTSIGVCECALSSVGLAYLGKLNIIETAVFQNCSCGSAKLSDEMKVSWREWIDARINEILTGKVELCSGYTGADFPAIGWAEQGTSEFNQARIIANDLQKKM